MARKFNGYGRGGAGMGGGMNMSAMIKKAQKMQEEMVKAQEELGNKEYTATAGGGAVPAVVKGSNNLVRLKLDPEAGGPAVVGRRQARMGAAGGRAGGRVPRRGYACGARRRAAFALRCEI